MSHNAYVRPLHTYIYITNENIEMAMNSILSTHTANEMDRYTLH